MLQYGFMSWVFGGVFWPRGMWDLYFSSPTRSWTHTPCIWSWSPNHSTREVPITLLNFLLPLLAEISKHPCVLFPTYLNQKREWRKESLWVKVTHSTCTVEQLHMPGTGRGWRTGGSVLWKGTHSSGAHINIITGEQNGEVKGMGGSGGEGA